MKAFEKIVGKRKTAFPTLFYFQTQGPQIEHYSICCLQMLSFLPFFSLVVKSFTKLHLNSLTNNKTSHCSILKGYAEKMSVREKLKFVLGSVENIVEKGENAGYQHFPLFPHFQKVSFSGSLKVGIVWHRFNPLPDDKILGWSKLKQIADDI